MYISSLPIWRSLFWQDDQIAAIRLINFCQLGDFYSVIFFYHHFKKKNRLKNRHLLFLLRIFFSLMFLLRRLQRIFASNLWWASRKTNWKKRSFLRGEKNQPFCKFLLVWAAKVFVSFRVFLNFLSRFSFECKIFLLILPKFWSLRVC